MYLFARQSVGYKLHIRDFTQNRILVTFHTLRHEIRIYKTENIGFLNFSGNGRVGVHIF